MTAIEAGVPINVKDGEVTDFQIMPEFADAVVSNFKRQEATHKMVKQATVR